MVPPALPPVRLLEPAPGRDPGRMEGPQPLVGPTGGAVGILRGLQLAPVTSLFVDTVGALTPTVIRAPAGQVPPALGPNLKVVDVDWSSDHSGGRQTWIPWLSRMGPVPQTRAIYALAPGFKVVLSAEVDFPLALKTHAGYSLYDPACPAKFSADIRELLS